MLFRLRVIVVLGWCLIDLGSTAYAVVTSPQQTPIYRTSENLHQSTNLGETLQGLRSNPSHDQGVETIQSNLPKSKFLNEGIELVQSSTPDNLQSNSPQGRYIAQNENTAVEGTGGSEDLSQEGEEFGEDLEDEFAAKDKKDVWDPLSGYNRFMTSFNDKVFLWLLDPVARGYRFIIPEFVRKGVGNFFHNLLFPLRFVNNLLQVKFKGAGVELARFTLNTTVGILGLWDPARVWFDLEPYEEDFGQTLGYWGVGAGPHIVLPFLGPSNLRDAISTIPDYYLDPKRFVDPYEKELAVRVYEEVNDTSLHIGEYQNIKKDALDQYTFFRDSYEQYRIQQIKE